MALRRQDKSKRGLLYQALSFGKLIDGRTCPIEDVGIMLKMLRDDVGLDDGFGLGVDVGAG